MQQDSFTLFIGYPLFETWFQTIDHSRPVYVTLLTEPGETNLLSIRIERLVIMAAQPEQGEDLVHYCRLVVGELRYLDGECANPKTLDAARVANDLVYEWLAKQDVVVRDAVIAAPANLHFRDGKAAFLKHDIARGYYI